MQPQIALISRKKLSMRRGRPDAFGVRELAPALMYVLKAAASCRTPKAPAAPKIGLKDAV